MFSIYGFWKVSIRKELQFRIILFLYKKFVTGKRTNVKKGCKLLNPYLVTVLSSILFNKLPCRKELKLTSKSLMIKQYDLVPTLAWLTGVPIPKNSLGSLIFKEPGDICENYNKLQISNCVGGHGKIEDIEIMVEKFEENQTEYSLPMMFSGIFIALVSSWMVFDHDLIKNFTIIDWLRIVHILSLFSTSFIEEEHQTIYFIATTFVATLLVKKDQFKSALSGMFLLRIARVFNQVIMIIILLISVMIKFFPIPTGTCLVRFLNSRIYR
jgi:hypothetical protein